MEEFEDDDIPDVVFATPPRRKRTKNSKAPVISEADLRRSLRLKKLNNGFKSSVCKVKNCLGCSADPPTISQHVIRDLGKSFCNIDPNDLTEERLNAKPTAAKKGVVKKKPIVGKKIEGGRKKPDRNEGGPQV